MATLSNPQDRAGWEAIWRSSNIPSRYQTLAAPDASLVEWAETLPPGASLLDLGCGIGRHTVYLGGRGFHMSGQDISPSGVEQTAAACAERGSPFAGKVSDMSVIPWADASFDAALSTATIHHQLRAGIAHTLGEVRRVLKPGGTLHVDFPCTDRDDYLLMRRLVAERKLTEIEPSTFVDERPDSEDIDGYLPHHYCDEADLRDLLSDFEIVRLWATSRILELPNGSHWGKWVAWARRPLSG